MDKELPSDSDQSDEDYVPSDQEDLPSEVESDGEPEEDNEGSINEHKSTKKRQSKGKKTRKPSSKKRKIDVPEPDPFENKSGVQEKIPDKVTEEEHKKKADSLWADFLKDTNFKSKTKTSQTSAKSATNSDISNGARKAEVKRPVPEKVKVTKIFEFAGEEVKVEKEVSVDSVEARLLSNKTESPSSSSTQDSNKPVARKPGGLGGLSSVLNHLGKKEKISTLEKTKLDWDKYKKEEDLEEEIKIFNKGKDGYLDKQDFLERTDFRQFEIEREFRNVNRKKKF